MSARLLVAALVLAGAGCSHSPETAPEPQPIKPMPSQQGWPPPPAVQNALFMSALNQRVLWYPAGPNNRILYVEASRVCTDWRVGVDFPRIVDETSDLLAWRRWQRAWLVHSATTTYCPAYLDRLPS